MRKSITAIEALRALACLLVVYCHVVGRPLVIFNTSWPPHTVINHYLTGPLGIIQNFGLLGVAIFFLISGFIITHTALAESRLTFLIKRVLRIYPPLIIAVFGVALLAKGSKAIGWTDAELGVGNTNILQAITGFDFFVRAQPMLGVGWSISVELFFYASVLIFMPLMKRAPLIFTSVMIAWSLAITMLLKFALPWCGYPCGIGATLFAYMPILCIGIAIYFMWQGRIRFPTGVALIVAAWIIFIKGLAQVNPATLTMNYPLQFALALGVFLSGLWFFEYSRKNPQIVRFFADISYSLYLVHLPLSVAVMYVVYPVAGITATICTGFIVAVIAAWALHFVEVYFQSMARRLTTAIEPKAFLETITVPPAATPSEAAE